MVKFPQLDLLAEMDLADLGVQSGGGDDMVRHEIVPDRNGVIVRIFDAPANGWRTIFVEKDSVIVRYENCDDALSGVRIYDGADKTAFFRAELEVYLEAAATGRPFGVCGLPSLARFGEPGHYIYATFSLTERFIQQSTHRIIGYKDNDPVYSAVWASPSR